MTRALVVLSLIALPLTAAAQRITITPTVGAYMPLLSQGTLPFGDINCDPASPCDASLTFALDRGVQAGLKVNVDWVGIVGLEASVATATAQRRREMRYWEAPAISDPTPDVERTATRTSSFALRVTLARPLGAQAVVGLGAGLSVTHLSGEGYREGSPEERLIVGPSVAATLGFALQRNMRLEISMEHRFYSINVPDARRTSMGQHDVVVSTGLSFVLGR